jgi:hypothetical protein
MNRIGDDAALWEFPDLQSVLHPLPCVRIAGVPYGPDDAAYLLGALDA